MNIDPDNLHHAYLISGNSDDVMASIESFLVESLAFPVIGNPDYWKETHETFGIDESRAISEIHRGRPLVHSRRIIVIDAVSITHEAQNALLKVLEEPVPHTHFFIIVPKESDLLLTVRSRMYSVSVDTQKLSPKIGETFLNLPLSDRMKEVQKLSDQKNKKSIDMFLQNLLVAARERLLTGVSGYDNYTRRLLIISDYIRMRGASTKSLLEYVALAVPRKIG